MEDSKENAAGIHTLPIFIFKIQTPKPPAAAAIAERFRVAVPRRGL